MQQLCVRPRPLNTTYIEDTDLSSKSTFGLLSQLFALQAGDVESVTPVLTLPVGG